MTVKYMRTRARQRKYAIDFMNERWWSLQRRGEDGVTNSQQCLRGALHVWRNDDDDNEDDDDDRFTNMMHDYMSELCCVCRACWWRARFLLQPGGMSTL